jgi:hypothetical protein
MKTSKEHSIKNWILKCLILTPQEIVLKIFYWEFVHQNGQGIDFHKILKINAAF